MIVTVPQDSNKHEVQINDGAPCTKVHVEPGSLALIRNRRMRACPPTITISAGRGGLLHFVEGWKHIMNNPYVLSIIAKGYRLRFKSPPLLLKTPWEKRLPQGQGSQKIQRM